MTPVPEQYVALPAAPLPRDTPVYPPLELREGLIRPELLVEMHEIDKAGYIAPSATIPIGEQMCD